MIPKDIYREHPELRYNILLGYRGSFVHGTRVPNTDPDCIDDLDVQGICLPPFEYYYGLKQFGSKGTKEIMEGEWDIVLFEFTKAIRLLKQGNPNILSLLWLQENHYLHITPLGQMIIDNRDAFTGKHVYHNYIGYARSQLHEITHGTCKRYVSKKRKGLMERYGYDTKNAAHVIRLLRMGIEFMNDGILYPTRADALQLKEIKKGEWSLDKIKFEVDKLFHLTEEAYTKSQLPPQADAKRISKLCIDVAEMYFDIGQSIL